VEQAWNGLYPIADDKISQNWSFFISIYFTFCQIFTDMEAVIEYIKIHESVQSICHNIDIN
jgi:hypothetical protein